jgi:hypothetical protein
VIAGYMYDSAGRPTWYYSSGRLTTFKQYKGKWQHFVNGQAIGGTYRPPAVANSDAGDLTIDFTGPSDALLTLPDGRKIPITRFAF